MRPQVLLPVLAICLFAACNSTRPAAPPPEELPKYAAGSEDDPEARDNWYWEQRAFPTGTIPIDVHRDAVHRELSETRALAAGELAWDSLGPAPLLNIPMSGGTTLHASGRILAVAPHPSEAGTILVGTAMGGIWKSVDGGESFYSTGPEQSLPTLSINVLKFKPDDPRVVYAGTGEAHGSTSMFGSGLLRSTDGGETWQHLPVKGEGWSFAYAAITGLQFDPRDVNTLYVTTATIQPSVFRTPPDLPQTGLFKSTNGGTSWQLLRAATKLNPTTSSVGFMDLEYGGAAAPDLIFVSEYYGGVLRSTDGGATFKYITPQKANGYGTFPQEIKELAYFDAGTRQYMRLKRFANPETNFDFRRVEIALAPSNPRILFAGYESASNTLDYNNSGINDLGDRTVATSLLFKSEDGGDTWRWLGTVFDGVPDYCVSQCYFDNVVTINPANENDILLGGMANYNGYIPSPLSNPTKVTEVPWRGMVYRSLDGGRTWVDTTPHCSAYASTPYRVERQTAFYRCSALDPFKVIHPDVHVLTFARDGSFYAGTDGGLYRALPTTAFARPNNRRRAVAPPPYAAGGDIKYYWENLNNGLSTLQFYRIATHPTNPNILLGGMQDNSCGYWNGELWEGWGGGDGTIAAFDPIDPKIIYLGSQFAVHRHMHGGTKLFSPSTGWKFGLFDPSKVAQGENTSFVPVFAIDRKQPTVLYGASNRGVYRSTDRGETWTRIMPGFNTEGAPTSISVSEVDPRRVWVSTSFGVVYRIDTGDGVPTITYAGKGLPLRYSPRVIAGIDSADTVYAVFSGYDANTPSTPGKVFMSTDAGATWKNISGNLPDVPASAIALDAFDVNRIWVALDTAVWSTSDRGATWTSERRNMPVVGILDLELNRNTGYLTAATHGRGVWRMKVRGTGQ